MWTEGSPELVEMAWDQVSGGDDQVDLQEYIDLRTRYGDEEQEISYDFESADLDDNDYLDHDEWINSE
jgi:hypothetical protein